MFRMKNSVNVIMSLGAAAALILISSSAFAETCKNLQDDNVWNTGLMEMKKAVDAKDYETALDRGREIYSICPESPSLNYYIGVAQKLKGDDSKALVYFQKASDNTFKYATAPEMSRMIFYARYEAENPERTQEAVDALKKERDAYQNEVQSLKESNARLETIDALAADQMSNDKALWTGVGLGSAGVIAAIVGGVLVATTDAKDQVEFEDFVTKKDGSIDYGSFENDKKEGKIIYVPKQQYSMSSKYIAGWVVMGIGIGLAVTGGVLTGIFGYQKTHPVSKDAISFNVSYNHVGLSFEF